MARPKHGVRFSHKGGNGSGSEGRRSSFSDVSEDGSPSRSKVQATLETVSEVRLQTTCSGGDSPLSLSRKGDHVATQEPRRNTSC